ncbi:MAG: hypothetical protein WB579_05030 [Bryobacteraceae bacterium]
MFVSADVAITQQILRKEDGGRGAALSGLSVQCAAHRNAALGPALLHGCGEGRLLLPPPLDCPYSYVEKRRYFLVGALHGGELFQLYQVNADGFAAGTGSLSATLNGLGIISSFHV